jgi:hypothetical protein
LLEACFTVVQVQTSAHTFFGLPQRERPQRILKPFISEDFDVRSEDAAEKCHKSPEGTTEVMGCIYEFLRRQSDEAVRIRKTDPLNELRASKARSSDQR